ncbi:HNH endonuclease [Bordetella genomosp. 10]|uniref:HNH endonuclease n=1 Tax=Bordetella genomosp. 10 TaxID=1416804 RepID=A0A261S3J9_9BORD|nr:HNH endonuclease signature motif containing protein [Bordetella genomosp. 10]OZI31745.1 HNH endonuclease [Bordetella genomosp. 10]
MAKYAMLKPRAVVAQPRRAIAPSPSEQRMTGRKLQARRLRLWSACPYCANCGKLTEFPQGFELDHKVPLHQGGADTDDNCQILCAGADGCHAAKTADDLGHRQKR